MRKANEAKSKPKVAHALPALNSWNGASTSGPQRYMVANTSDANNRMTSQRNVAKTSASNGAQPNSCASQSCSTPPKITSPNVTIRSRKNTNMSSTEMVRRFQYDLRSVAP